MRSKARTEALRRSPKEIPVSRTQWENPFSIEYQITRVFQSQGTERLRGQASKKIDERLPNKEIPRCRKLPDSVKVLCQKDSRRDERTESIQEKIRPHTEYTFSPRANTNKQGQLLHTQKQILTIWSSRGLDIVGEKALLGLASWFSSFQCNKHPPRYEPLSHLAETALQWWVQETEQL